MRMDVVVGMDGIRWDGMGKEVEVEAEEKGTARLQK